MNVANEIRQANANSGIVSSAKSGRLRLVKSQGALAREGVESLE